MRALPLSTAQPFDFAGERRSVLLLHGFTGSPYEVRPLAEVLAERGYHCVGPCLAGHGSTPEQLARVTADDILASARAACAQLQGPVFVCGLSMGALVAALLANEMGERVRGLIMMAPALRLGLAGRGAVRLTRRGLWRMLPYVPKVVRGGDCGDRDGRLRNPGYAKHPLKALLALDELGRRTRRQLPDLRCDTLIVHGARDRTIPVSSAREVQQRCGAKDVSLKVLPRSRHLLPLDVERDLLGQLVLDFMQRRDEPK